MKSVMIRILWPQADTIVAVWQCEYCTTTQEDVSSVVVMPFQDACRAAAELQAQDIALDVRVILPAEVALLHAVQLPVRSQRQALQALPFVVEEQLAEDLEDVHLAIGSRSAEGAWPAIVVDVAIMSGMKTCWEAAALRLRAVHVDADLFAVTENSLAIALMGERVLLHTRNSIAAFEKTEIADMLPLFLGDVAPQQVSVFQSGADEGDDLLVQQWQTEFTALGDTSVSVQVVENASALLVSCINANTQAVNLLQGKFQVKQLAGKLPVWKIAAVSLVMLWLMQCSFQWISGGYFNYQAGILEKQVEGQFRQWFPDARRSGSVRKQLESRLLEGAGGDAATSFAKLFSASIEVMNAMPDHQGMSIDNLRYENQEGQLEFEIKAKSIDQLDQYKMALSKAGLNAKIASANDSDGGISGRMQISRGL